MTTKPILLWTSLILAVLALCAAAPIFANGDASTFGPRDVFELEYASDPQIAPDGSRIVYARTRLDIMTDRPNSDLWTVNWDGSGHRPLVAGKASFRSPRWSPSGDRLAYVSSDEDGRSQIFVRYSDTGQIAKLTHLERGPGGLSWSPDGQWIAFSMFVPDEPQPFAEMPAKPKGAKWAPPARVYDTMFYRSDGGGFSQARLQPTLCAHGRRRYAAPTHDGQVQPRWHALLERRRQDALLFRQSARELGRRPERQRGLRARPRLGRSRDAHLPPRSGPRPHRLARRQAHCVLRLRREVSRPSEQPAARDGTPTAATCARWAKTSTEASAGRAGRATARASTSRTRPKATASSLRISLDGEVGVLADNFGGLSLGRPYGGGQYSVSKNDRFAFTVTNPSHPADLAVVEQGKEPRRLTRLNDDLFGHKELGARRRGLVEVLPRRPRRAGLDRQAARPSTRPRSTR